MGDRYVLALRCDWCGEMNDDVWYAPSSGATMFTCRYCKKPNEITTHHDSRKVIVPKPLKKGSE